MALACLHLDATSTPARISLFVPRGSRALPVDRNCLLRPRLIGTHPRLLLYFGCPAAVATGLPNTDTARGSTPSTMGSNEEHLACTGVSRSDTGYVRDGAYPKAQLCPALRLCAHTQ